QDAGKRDKGDLSVKTRIRLAGMVDEVGRLVARERSEVKAFLDLNGVTPDLDRELIELLGGHNPTSPYADQLARLDRLSGEDGFAAGHVTILDFTFVGEVSRTVVLAHDTSAYRAERGAPQYIDWRRPAAPGLTTARRESPSRGEAYEKLTCPSTKK